MSHDPTDTQPCAWRDRFEVLVRDRMRAPFAWGQHDCCLWAADAVQAVNGTDPAADLRGTYNDALSAARVLQQLGGIDAAGARCGEPIAPLLASVGDIGLIEVEGRQSLAVCTGEHWLAPAATGLGTVAFSAAQAAWRVARG